MAKKNGNELALLGQQEETGLATRVMDMFGGDTGIQIPIDAPLPQIKILRETPQFELPDGESVKEIIGNILYWHHANQYYDKPFGKGEGNGVPACASSNGIAPDGGENPQEGPCRECPLNQYKSAVGPNGEERSGKACQNTIRLYVLIEGDIIPCLLKAPPSSLGKKESLMRWLTSALNVSAKAGLGNKYQPIVVKFSLHRKDFASGMSASVLDLETCYALSLKNETELPKIERLSRLYQDFMQNYLGRVKQDVASEKQEDLGEELPI